MYQRLIIKPIREALEDTPVNVVVGPRQVGKTTLCLQLLQLDAFKGQAITLDDPTMLSAAKADPLGFINQLDKHLIIDEIQRVPELLLSIKKLVDEDRNGRRIILTGSANVMVLPQVADSLAGRIEIHKLWPLSQSELQGKETNFLNNLVSAEGRFQNNKAGWGEVIEAIKTGGYPEAVLRSSDSRRGKWFESYIKSVLQKDIRDLSRIEGLIELPKIIHLLASRIGSTINLSEIGRLANIKNSTMYRYLSLLENVFMILRVPAWTPNTEGEFVKSPRFFMNDTGLLCHLMGENTKTLETNRTLTGHFLENFIVMEIIKQLTWTELYLKPFHFSMHKGAEVNLVLEDRQKNLYGIEIKSKASVNKADFKGLAKLAEIAGDKFKRGIVLYSGEHTVGGFGENLLAVPIGALWA